jgi:hypothetical protein
LYGFDFLFLNRYNRIGRAKAKVVELVVGVKSVWILWILEVVVVDEALVDKVWIVRV